MTATISATLHLSVHTVCVPDNERGRDAFYPGTLVYSAHLDRDIAELWLDDTGMCWREVNDNLRPDRLAYGHASSLDDALAAVVRQAATR